MMQKNLMSPKPHSEPHQVRNLNVAKSHHSQPSPNIRYRVLHPFAGETKNANANLNHDLLNFPSVF
jgi:hypothetical protein